MAEKKNETVNPLAGLTVAELRAGRAAAAPGLTELLRDGAEAVTGAVRGSASGLFGQLGGAASWAGMPTLGAHFYAQQEQANAISALRAQEEAAREAAAQQEMARYDAELARRPATATTQVAEEAPLRMVPLTANISDAFGNSMGQATGGRGNLSFSPILEYSPEQKQLRAFAEAMAGMPVPHMEQFMRALPQAPKQPGFAEMSGQDYRALTIQNFRERMENAQTREEEMAAQQEFAEAMLALSKIPPYLVQQQFGN